MKITGSVPSVTPNDTAGRTKTVASGNQKSAATTAEQVDLSSLSARLQDVETAMADTPSIDAARVAEIKQAISEGRFHINPERIADGLLASVQQMLAHRQD
jgi:negative regulator of flagellin synthesis FlgM